jgi:hypothetical protein
MGAVSAPGALRDAPEEKYSIIPMALHCFSRLHIVQPQREGDGRQALVVPPLYPAPATSLIPAAFFRINPDSDEIPRRTASGVD